MKGGQIDPLPPRKNYSQKTQAYRVNMAFYGYFCKARVKLRQRGHLTNDLVATTSTFCLN